MYAATNDIPGVYNVAGDGNLPWSEVCAIVGKRRIALPFVLTGLAAEPMRRLRLWDLPSVALRLLRFGRSLDNTRFKRAGFRYAHTSAGAVEAFAQGPAARGDGRRPRPVVPLRARRRRLLPALPRSCEARLMEHERADAAKPRTAQRGSHHVRLEQRDAVAIVTLVDLERRNAMTGLMVEEIVQHVRRARS